ncbi:uncharacterized protein K02A2.6-like [Wyeomyia smithii]|uniref:uncharacterized protein K02A2.6-like n=1 Tax=Wyeomyia smithii TaxID=174621 RepID=UPI002467FFAB|nr:uncharacterized protein K02A2.6-like [Wyeomyia smithii]
MSDQVANYIRNCEICMEFSGNQSKPPMTTHQIPQYPFQRVNIDLGEIKTGDKKLTLMVTADSYSDFVEVDFLNDTKTRTIVTACKRNFARHGSPEVVVTDNGPQFDNNEWTSFACKWDFVHVTSSPYHAQGNVLQQHRNTPNAIGSSPNQRLYSRNTRSVVPVITNRLKPPKAPQVEENIRHKRAVTKVSYNKNEKKLPNLSVGADVLVQRRPDLGSTWEKAVLLRRLEDQSYEVQTKDGAVYRRSAVHVKPGKQVQLDEQVELRRQRRLNQEREEKLHQEQQQQVNKASFTRSNMVNKAAANSEKYVFERHDYGATNVMDQPVPEYQKQHSSLGTEVSNPSNEERDSPTTPTARSRRNSKDVENIVPSSSGRPKREIIKPSRFLD